MKSYVKKIHRVVMLAVLLFIFLLGGCVQKQEKENVIVSISIQANKTEAWADNNDIIRFSTIAFYEDGKKAEIKPDEYVIQEKTLKIVRSFLDGYKALPGEAGEYEVYAKLKNLTSGSINVNYKAPAKLTKLIISATKDMMSSDNVDEVKFNIAGEDQYGSINNPTNVEIWYEINNSNEQIDSNTFKTTQSGIYLFYAKAGEIISNKTTVTAVSPNIVIPKITKLTISANKNKLIADNKDIISLSTLVEDQDGKQMNGVVVEYWNEFNSVAQKMNSDTLKTTVGGIYTLYSKVENIVSNKITISAVDVQVENPDIKAPEGTIAIKDNVKITSGNTITVIFSATDDLAKTIQMSISRDKINWNDWETLVVLKDIKLKDADGEETIYVKYKDEAGNISPEYSAKILIDRTPPVISELKINNGAAFTNSKEVSIAMTTTEAVFIAVSNDNISWTSWNSYTDKYKWTLTDEEGQKKIYVKTMDSIGNISEISQASITLKTFITGGALYINNGNEFTTSGSVVLTILSADAKHMRFTTDKAVYTEWESFRETKQWNFYEEGLVSIFAELKDDAGNIQLVSAKVILDTRAPVGRIEIKDNEKITSKSSIIVITSAEDLNGIYGRNISIGNEILIPILGGETVTSTSINIENLSDGEKIIKAVFTDLAGNIYTTITSINIDRTAPEIKELIVNDGLEYANSLIVPVEIKVAQAENLRVFHSIDNTNWIQGGLNQSVELKEGKNSIYVRLADMAGNETTTSSSIIVDTSAPVLNEVKVNDGAAFTDKVDVNLSIMADGADYLRVSNDNTNWSEWQAYANAITWKLTDEDGGKHVYVSLKDKAGNISNQVTASITLKTNATSGAVTINNGAEFTSSSAVKLSLEAKYAKTMRLSTDKAIWTPEESFVTTRDWTFDGEYAKVIYVEITNDDGVKYIVEDYIIVDKTKPVITLSTGTAIVLTQAGTPYIDQGVNAKDNQGLTNKVVVTGEVNTLVLGEYTLKYNIIDEAGNRADEVIRTVKVIDTTKPVITLMGDKSITIEAGIEYKDPGAIATDNLDGDISVKIVKSGIVSTSAVGVYTIIYNVADSKGNSAQAVTRNVTVQDTTPPKIEKTSLEGSIYTLNLPTTLVEDGFTITDNVSDDLTSRVVVTASSVDVVITKTSAKPYFTYQFKKLGTYKLYYTVTDIAGNKSEPNIYTVNVIDNTKPKIVLNGTEIVTYEAKYGSSYPDPGATATDNIDGTITLKIVTAGAIDTGVVGVYTRTYTVSDTSGNTSTMSRTVKVVDTTKPQIVLNSTATLKWEAGTEYVEPGAVVKDNVKEDITTRVAIAGSVNTKVLGNYIIKYNVADTAGNTAVEVARTVSVVDTTKPIIKLLGYNNIIIPVGSTYVDAGVTVEDNIPITTKIVTTSTLNVGTEGAYTITYNISDASGNAATAVVRKVTVLSEIVAVSCGDYHTVVTKQDGTLWGMGNNQRGQLGDASVIDQKTLTKNIHIGNGLTVSAGGAHTLELARDGTVYSTGENNYGQLGINNIQSSTYSYQVSKTGIASISAGKNHSLAVDKLGNLWATGRNAQGQLGDGTQDNSVSFKKIDTNVSTRAAIMGSKMAVISAGKDYSVYIKEDGSLWGMGTAFSGQLGLGSQNTGNYYTPQKIMDGVDRVAAGYDHTMILKKDGTLWATGANNFGQLGDGTTENKYTPVQIMSDVHSAAVGNGYTMILKKDGTLWGVGNNAQGQLGANSITTINKVPLQVESDVEMVYAGHSHTVYLKKDKTLWGTGVNEYGELGSTIIGVKLFPIKIYSISEVFNTVN